MTVMTEINDFFHLVFLELLSFVFCKINHQHHSYQVPPQSVEFYFIGAAFAGRTLDLVHVNVASVTVYSILVKEVANLRVVKTFLGLCRKKLLTPHRLCLS